MSKLNITFSVRTLQDPLKPRLWSLGVLTFWEDETSSGLNIFPTVWMIHLFLT